LLTSARYGSIVAAPTFALPEAIGGSRNWDYRYCWIRDSAFTVYAFIRLGLKEEAIAFMRWVEGLYKHSVEANGALQLMYRIDGRENLEESVLEDFKGYRDSRPVRIGNEAYRQFQLDIYGELLDAMALADTHITKISHDAWQNLILTADYVCDNWNKPDAGIWEFRGEKREFLHSRLMCWVALDRALRLAREESLPARIKRWNDTRTEIYNDIFENFWSDDLKSFVQHKEATTVDASVLLMPLVDFIGAHDPRWLSTLDAVGRILANDALVRRYRADQIDLQPADGHEEGSFNACSFWYIACLARAGRRDEARLLFAKMTSYANHLGLYAEETGRDGRQLGNFPQAFTHLALINAVFALDESDKRERAGNR
jgi:GH15 family glucan-1,4-alpha-glucosidase